MEDEFELLKRKKVDGNECKKVWKKMTVRVRNDCQKSMYEKIRLN